MGGLSRLGAPLNRSRWDLELGMDLERGKGGRGPNTKRLPSREMRCGSSRS